MLEFVINLIIILIVFQYILVLACACTWLERKASALLQDRVGANRSGTRFYFKSFWLKPLEYVLRISGVLGLVNTFFCDPLKALFKEDFIPENGSRFLHTLAPIIAVAPVFLAFAVIPLAPKFHVPFYDKEILVQVASLDVGILLIIAMGGLAAYGVMLAGWASGNKFSLLGGLRGAAQLISYELAFGVSFLTLILVFGNLNIYDIVANQGEDLASWGIFKSPLTCLILFIVGMAETKRTPFDLPEAESELVSGYLTEYSGMKFFLFWIGEFAEIGLISLIIAVFFFSGWNLPFINLNDGSWLSALIGFFILFFKVIFFCALQIVIRWTLPRFRYDQLMNLGWKILFPLSVINLLITAALKLAW